LKAWRTVRICGHDDGAVEVLGVVGEVFVELFPADGARLLAARST
jgi:hypothetical protein